MKLLVECYSGHKAHERPLRFSLGGAWHEVAEVLDQWYGPGYSYFKVRDIGGSTFILRYDEKKDCWELTYYEKHPD